MKVSIHVYQTSFPLPVVVESHACLLKERPDPSFGDTLRSSLLNDELCYCQSVITARFLSSETCSGKNDPTYLDLWFVDDPAPLTQRQNWNKETLDRLLGRVEFCGKRSKSSIKGANSYFFLILFCFFIKD